MEATTIVKETDKLERWAVIEQVGKKWKRVAIDKSGEGRNDFEFQADAIIFAEKRAKRSKNADKKLKVVKLVEVETKTVTTIVDEDHGLVVSMGKKER